MTTQDAAFRAVTQLEQLTREALRLELEQQLHDVERHIVAGEASIAKSQLRASHLRAELEKLKAADVEERTP